MGVMMYNNLPLTNIKDYFKPLSLRTEKGTYFYRITVWNSEIENFIEKLLQEISRCGIYFSDKIVNPDNRQLAYYNEIMGAGFKLEEMFFYNSIKKWMPRISDTAHKNLSQAIYKVIYDYHEKGKNSSMVFNAYVKIMCMLYYRFESLLLQVGKDIVPKILYEGDINESILKLLYVLAKTGCDIALIQKQGDAALQIDPESKLSSLYQTTGTKFSPTWSSKEIREKLDKRGSVPELIALDVKKLVKTNTWLTGDILSDSSKKQNERGNPTDAYYNIFAGMWGAEEENEYYNMLFKWKMKQQGSNRAVYIIQNGIMPPDNTEVSRIRRGKYTNKTQALEDLAKQLNAPLKEVKDHAYNAVISILNEDDIDSEVQKYVNKLTTLLCWMNRFMTKIFTSEPVQELNTIVYYGRCRNKNEELFLQILSRLPIDVLIITPDHSEITEIDSRLFFYKKYPYSFVREKFPSKAEEVKFGTTAYNAEQDLNTLMYQDTGLYRIQQFKKAVPIVIKTTYEEIEILWSQEAVFRPNFETLTDRVLVPVIFSKISGVKGSIDDYWYYIAKLIEEDVYVIKYLPYITNSMPNPFKEKVTSYINNGKIYVDRIKSSSLYSYSFIRDEMQKHMFDTMQKLIDSKLIIGTGTRGTEYAIVSTLLNMDKSLLRMIQKYDFTKKIPKLIIIHLNENNSSLEDSILAAYLSMIGFDVLVFTPTGYNSVERHFASNILLEHNVGEYIYDLKIPDFEKVKRKKEGILNVAEKLFRRGK